MNTSIDQRDLVKAVRKYRNLDDQLKIINANAYKLREDRKFVENEMGDILRRTHFQNLHKLEIQDDGSYIKIQRPETWSKPWSLSQKELKDLTNSYFASHIAQTLTADGLFQWIVEHKKRDMVAREFSFKRVMNVDTNDGEDDNDATGGRMGARVDA